MKKLTLTRRAHVEANVLKLKSLKRQQKALEEQIKVLEDQIKDIMNDTSIYDIQGEDVNGEYWKVTWNMVASNRFDQKTFKEQNPALYSQYQAVSESRRFLVV